MTQLPALVDPLVPPDCDVRGLPFMPFEIIRFLESDLVALATPEEGWASVLLWAKSWLQVPAGSMPDDDRVLAKAAGVSPGEWRGLRDQVLKSWRRASDGRLYHPVVSEKALEAWIERLAYQKRSAAGNAARHGTAYDPADFERRMLACLSLLQRLNAKSAAELAKAHKLLLGAETAPSRKGNGSYKDASRSENGSEVTGTGTGTGIQKKQHPPSERAAKKGAGKKLKPPAKPKSESTAQGSRLPIGWFADEECRAYARGRGFSDEEIDQIEEDFRLWWPAQPGAKGRKTDWKLTWMTWVRTEEKRRGRNKGTGSNGRGVQSTDSLRAMHEGLMVNADKRAARRV